MKPIFFVHLPSSGGTTFWSVLRAAYGTRDTFRINDVTGKQVKYFENQFRQDETDKKTAIGGHLFHSFAKQYCGERDFITFLRDPVDRAISVYYRKVRKNMWQPSELIDNDVVKFWESRKGRGQMPSYFGPENPSDCTVENVIANIQNNFTCYGTMQYFDESLFMMASSLGWKRVPVYSRKNIGGNRPKVTPDHVREELSELMKFDVEVYASLIAEFERRWTAHEATMDPSQLSIYRKKVSNKSKLNKALNFGRNPFVQNRP